MAEHEEILEALSDRDGPRLASILKRHLENTCETVKEVIRAMDDKNVQAKGAAGP